MQSSRPNHDVLVVDDSPVYRQLIEELVSGHGYTALLAANGAEALQILSEKAPALVITDCMLPDLSGLEICERIRADKVAPYTYVILISGHQDKTSVIRGLEAGA